MQKKFSSLRKFSLFGSEGAAEKIESRRRCLSQRAAVTAAAKLLL